MHKSLEEMSYEELATWIVSQCLIFGSQVSTAYKVAAVFIEGLERHES